MLYKPGREGRLNSTRYKLQAKLGRKQQKLTPSVTTTIDLNYLRTALLMYRRICRTSSFTPTVN